ncbi:DUF523 domain-containing protein [Lysinibacillus fusiformis]|uniref:DUF523 domain-containing protein n=1 Tax=Lysinibacillus fusiformis TaxID=28031 RepID=UPI00382E2378
MILISACLAGLNVRYNGTNCIDDRVQKLVLEKKAITVCPELMGGFSTPREPAEILFVFISMVTEVASKSVDRKIRTIIRPFCNFLFLK